MRIYRNGLKIGWQISCNDQSALTSVLNVMAKNNSTQEPSLFLRFS